MAVMALSRPAPGPLTLTSTSLTPNGFGGTLSGKWGALAAAFETYCTRAGPAQCVTVRIRNCHQRVIERRFDMHNSSADITPRFALLGLGHF